MLVLKRKNYSAHPIWTYLAICTSPYRLLILQQGLIALAGLEPPMQYRLASTSQRDKCLRLPKCWIKSFITASLEIHFLFVRFLFETGSHCVILAVLELTM